jgi:hypothetical protein
LATENVAFIGDNDMGEKNVEEVDVEIRSRKKRVKEDTAGAPLPDQPPRDSLSPRSLPGATLAGPPLYRPWV